MNLPIRSKNHENRIKASNFGRICSHLDEVLFYHTCVDSNHYNDNHQCGSLEIGKKSAMANSKVEAPSSII